MNGKKSIEDYWKKKETQLKKRYTLYLLASLILTNSTVFFSNIQEKSSHCDIHSDWRKLNQPGNKKFVLKTENYIHHEDLAHSLPITIIDESNKILAKKAWLHKTVNKNDYQENAFISYVEIKKSDLIKFIKNDSRKYKIFPYSSEIKTKNTKQWRSYELVF